VGLARDGLLGAGLLTSTAATAAAAALAHGVFGFVEEAGHVCDCLFALLVVVG